MERAGDRMHVEPARAAHAIDAVRAQRQDPGVFAAYFDVAHALFGDDLERARTTFDELLERTTDLLEFEIVRYSPALGIDYERFPRLVFAEFSPPIRWSSPNRGSSCGRRRSSATPST